MTAISDKRAALLADGFDVGAPTTNESNGPGGGKYRRFANADIYWSATTGAHEVHGAIRTKYDALGGPGSFLGYPTTDELGTPDGRGRYSNFQGASLYFDWFHTDQGAYLVYGPPPPCDDEPAEHGEWQVAPYESGVVGVHAALLRNHKVLFFTYLEPPTGAAPAPVQYGTSAVLDLHTGFISTPAYHGDTAPNMENLFCSAHAFLADGRLFVAGGERDYPGIRTESVKKIHLFTPGGPGGGHWDQSPVSFARGRWYPECVTLPDGKVLTVGGSVRATTNGLSNWTIEIYDPHTHTVGPEIPADVVMNWSSFPFVFVLPSNKVLIHAGTTTRFFSLASQTFDPTSLQAVSRPGRNSRTYPDQGTAVLLPLMPDSTPPYNARVMMIGGAGPDPIHIDTDATASCEILDMGQTPLQWRAAPSMSQRRVMPDAVLLPDGTVFVVNGSREGGADLGASPVYLAEIYDPVADEWRDACHMSTPRLYHATALLLPDGRVLTAGTDSAWNPVPYNQAQQRVEIYSPPYLFAGPRPVLGTTPTAGEYGDQLVIPSADADAIDRVAIVRCGSTTHSFNPDQRYVGLVITARDATSVTVALPPDATIAPPGYYLLFGLTAEGVPSQGRYLRVGEGVVLKPIKENKELKEIFLEKVPHTEGKPILEDWPKNPKEKDKDAEDPGQWHEQPDWVGPVLARLDVVEKDVTRMRAFIEPHERPEVGVHAGMGEHGAHKASSFEPGVVPPVSDPRDSHVHDEPHTHEQPKR